MSSARRRQTSAGRVTRNSLAREGAAQRDWRQGGLGDLQIAPVESGVERERVVDIQRARMLGATIQVVAERGAANVTVGHVVERAGVSRRTFYELFTDCEDCLLAALDAALEQLCERVLAAYDPAAPWRARIRASLCAVLELFDEQPALARLLAVESLAGGPSALERRRRALEPAIAAVEEGRRASAGGGPGGPVALTGEGVVGAVLALIHSRILCADGSPLTGLANELMSMIVLPYLGSVAARGELQRPLPQAATPPRGEQTTLRSDPFKDAGMRLTYRTMCVLAAVAQQPGCSNRQVGDLAGMTDQGQVSKLLARLERVGLIVNGGIGHARGQANAWTLTDAGREIEHGLERHMQSTRTQGGRR